MTIIDKTLTAFSKSKTPASVSPEVAKLAENYKKLEQLAQEHLRKTNDVCKAFDNLQNDVFEKSALLLKKTL